MAEATTPQAETSGGQPELKRVIGPKLLLLFIVGDILGTGIYAVTGKIAGEVGGLVWAPFLVAFLVATITAFSYLELVTKYPQAAGAALYVHKAFGVHFVTFLVAFTVMCSGITSASTAARAFAANLEAQIDVIREPFGFGPMEGGDTLVTVMALGFIGLVLLINLRGVAEGVWTNVVLTSVELLGLLIVIFVGLFALGGGQADFSRVVIFEDPTDKGIFLAVTTGTTLAFFAMVGFEDSVNMAEETKDPVKIFPKILLTGLTITGVIYLLVSIVAVAMVPAGVLTTSETPLLEVVRLGGAAGFFEKIFPLISMTAVANSALINMMMASRLLYGMAKQRVLPPAFGRVLPQRRSPWVAILVTTGIAAGLIMFVGQVSALGGTTALLLLAVFTIVNVACLVLRRKPQSHKHFVAPTVLPIIGALACGFLVGPWTGRDSFQYVIAGILLAIGVVLWLITWLFNRAIYGRKTYVKEPEDLDTEGPVN